MLHDATDLSVTIRDLAPVLVASLSLRISAAAGTFSADIGRGFEVVKAWAEQHGFDPRVHQVIGVPQVEQRQLIGYTCCVELPAPVAGTESIQVSELTGGRYAVLTLEKDSATIGQSIGRFFGEYVPRHQLAIDAARPTYEIYRERTLEFCAPLA